MEPGNKKRPMSPKTPDNGESNPLASQWQVRQDARHELALLKSQSDDAILVMARSVRGFAALERLYDFYISREVKDTLQLSFGHRSMFRATADQKKTAAEDGPSLVYSLGPTGQFSTILYPVKSDLGRPYEDHLFLQIGASSATKLIEGMPNDLRLMVAYAHVTSIDMSATWSERARIWLLRLLCHRGQDGKFRKAPIWSAMLGFAGFGARTFATASILSLLKPLGLVLLLIVLAWFGWDSLASLVRELG